MTAFATCALRNSTPRSMAHSGNQTAEHGADCGPPWSCSHPERSEGSTLVLADPSVATLPQDDRHRLDETPEARLQQLERGDHAGIDACGVERQLLVVQIGHARDDDAQPWRRPRSQTV